MIETTFDSERRKNERNQMFRKYNGISEKLYKDKGWLYLKADKDNFNFANAKDTEVSILRAITESNPLKIILDLEHIQKIDSASIGVLVFLRSECGKLNKEIILLNVSEPVAKVFKMLMVIDFFRIVQNMNEV